MSCNVILTAVYVKTKQIATSQVREINDLNYERPYLFIAFDALFIVTYAVITGPLLGTMARLDKNFTDIEATTIDNRQRTCSGALPNAGLDI